LGSLFVALAGAMHVASEVLWLSLVNAVFCTFRARRADHARGSSDRGADCFAGGDYRAVVDVALSWLVLGERYGVGVGGDGVGV